MPFTKILTSNSIYRPSFQSNYSEYYSEIEICTVSSIAHPKAAIQIRNREMVNRANLILCAIEHEKGGAWQTIQYALQQGKPVINLAKERVDAHGI